MVVSGMVKKSNLKKHKKTQANNYTSKIIYYQRAVISCMFAYFLGNINKQKSRRRQKRIWIQNWFLTL